MQDIYNYLKQKCRDRNVKIDDIVTNSGVSRTTIYRMMKGLLKPTPEVYNLFINMLDLDKREVEQLDYYIKLTDVDESQIIARNGLRNMIFKSSEQQTNAQEVEFIVYDGEKRIVKYSEILTQMAGELKESNPDIQVSIFNCIDNVYLDPMINFLKALDKSLNIEHLVSFSDNKKHENVMALKAIIPLMQFNNYALYFKNEEVAFEQPLIHDLILIQYPSSQSTKYIVLSFEKNSMSDCHISTDKGMYDFLINKYKNIKQSYKNIPVKHNSLINFHNTLYDLEAHGDCCMVKSNPCYHRIPISVYEAILKIHSEDKLAEAFGINAFEIKAMSTQLFKGLFDRNNLSLKYQQTDVFTKEGLVTLAEEGKLSDHYSFIEPFSKDEVKAILESILNKHRNPRDKYTLYITKVPMMDNNMVIGAFENSGVMLEYFDGNCFDDNVSSCIIEQDVLAKSIFDFINNYVPQNLAMSELEAEQFIEHLIKTYC